MVNFVTLKTPNEFLLVKKKSKEIKTRYFFVNLANKDILNKRCYDSEKIVFGITISKKIGNSVVRNLLRRRVKSILNQIDIYKITNKSIISLYPKKTTSSAPFCELKKEIEKIIRLV
jgi:ribonuclease P protein component